MKASIVYDNTAHKGYRSGWGFSCLVNEKILFDTGEAPEPLFYDMNRLKIDIDAIDTVVISHDHWDHTGGLWELLKKQKGLRFTLVSGFSSAFKKKAG